MNLTVLNDDVKSCTACSLSKTCSQVVTGKGGVSPLFIIGDYANSEDDLMGEPFSDRAGQFFLKLLSQAGIKDTEVYFSYAVKCKTTDPTEHQVNSCKSWLWKEIQLQQPKIIITLGGWVTKLLLKKSKLKDVVGIANSVSYTNAVIYPWYTPSHLLTRGKASDKKTIEFLRTIKEQI